MGASRPVTAGRTGLWERGTSGPAPRGDSVPTPAQEIAALRRELTQHLTQQRAMFQELQRRVGILDSLIYEHDTQELPPTQSTFTLTLQPQTTQTEEIRGLFCSITVPTMAAAPTITLTNAWAQLGSDYINLNAILNSAAGTGGFLPGMFRFIISSKAARTCNIVASSNWPAGAYLSFALFGEAVPTMDGGVLH